MKVDLTLNEFIEHEMRLCLWASVGLHWSMCIDINAVLDRLMSDEGNGNKTMINYA